MSIFARLFGTNKADKPTDAEPMRFYVGLEIEVVPLKGKALNPPVVIDVTPIEAPKATTQATPKASKPRKGKSKAATKPTPTQATPEPVELAHPEPIKIHRDGFAKIEITNPVTFARDLATLKAVVPTRTPKPVLKNIVIEVFNDTSVKAYATDLEHSIALELSGVHGASPGKFCVNLDALIQATKAPKGKSVTLRQCDDGLSVSNGNSSRTLPIESDLSLFPEVPSYPDESSVALEMATMLRMVSTTVHAADCSNTRFALGGMLLELLPSDSTLRVNAVATDGKRLERESVQVSLPKLSPKMPMAGIIPMNTLKLIERFKDAKYVSFTFSDKTVFFSIPHRAVIFSRCIDGRFPRYQEVFPSGCDTSLAIPDDAARRELSKALTEAAKFMGDDPHRTIDFAMDSQAITINARHSEDTATSSWKVPMPRYGGPCVKATVDASYLGDAIGSHNAPIAIEFGAKSPIVIRSGSHDSVIMPLTGGVVIEAIKSKRTA
jgi:DNA polymerase-3 subunit beta